MKLTRNIQKAINQATILHYGQKRKSDGTPYILHPYSVAVLLSEYTDNEDIIIAGLLHDILEDVPSYTIDNMRKEFGDKITEIVNGVTEKKHPDNSNKNYTWDMRKKEYIETLKQDSFESLMVCAADKIHNLKSIMDEYEKLGEKSFKNFNAPIKKRMWYYREVLNILKQRLDNKIVDRLEQIYNKAEKTFEIFCS